MTPTDRDRRRVATELRKRRGGWSSGECYYTIINALGLPDTSREDGGHALYAALADLIEPDEPKVKCVAEVKIDGERLEKLAYGAAVELTGIDRDELLEEVKELERCAGYFGLDFDEDEPLRDRLKEAAEDFAGCASRIREALGVES